MLSRALPGFRPRPAQAGLAQAMVDAMEAGEDLVAEAGTGTGKTFAYLVPAILSGKKTIIATATKTLQDQLFHKDLPVIRRVLARPLRVALLKGRNNYLCLYRLRHVLGFRPGQGSRDVQAFEGIRRWAKTTQTGDITEASDVPEQTPLWSAATSTVDNCLGQDCPDYGECFLVRARNRARESDLLVINHHLLWADWALRNEGYGELLPQVDVVVVDEAHQFVESASQFLGISVTSRQLKDLAGDIVIERLKDAPDAIQLTEEADRLDRLVDDGRLVLGVDAMKDSWHTVEQNQDVLDAFSAIGIQLELLGDLLKIQAVRGKGLESCHKRCLELSVRLTAFLQGKAENHVRWFETRKRGFALNHTPLEIAGEFARFRATHPATWIFTSATLTVTGQFDHFKRQLGLFNARSQVWESPFDYRNNALLYLPPGLPEPGAMEHTRMAVATALPVLRASKGRAFLLFTSHHALSVAADILHRETDYPLFVQGTQPKSRLLAAFRVAGNGILLGTASFWEGVDVPGPALSCVIIDKLPFSSPGDPVLSARMDIIRRSGFNPFTTYQLPAAIIMLKQGFGRLIRDQNDRGVLMLCDPRIRTRSYGKLFLKSLPEVPVTNNLPDVEQFFAAHDQNPASLT